jgi:hypothetical protein
LLGLYGQLVRKVVLQINGKERGDESPCGSIRMISRRTDLFSATLVFVTGENWGKSGLFEGHSVVLHYKREKNSEKI